MISSFVFDKLCENLLKKIDCDKESILSLVSDFFDIYEEIYKRVEADPDYQLAISKYPELLKENDVNLVPSVLTVWKNQPLPSTNFELEDPKRRVFRSVFGRFENTGFSKYAKKKELRKLDRIAKEIRTKLDKRFDTVKVLKQLNYSHCNFKLDDLKKYSPYLYDAYITK